LTQALATAPDAERTVDALAGYEAEMITYATDVVAQSCATPSRCSAWTSPRSGPGSDRVDTRHDESCAAWCALPTRAGDVSG
jgi:hypothetical protein